MRAGREGCTEQDKGADRGVCAGREKGCTKAQGGYSRPPSPPLSPGPPSRTEQLPPAPPARARHRGPPFPPRQLLPLLAAAGRAPRAHWLKGMRGRGRSHPAASAHWSKARRGPAPAALLVVAAVGAAMLGRAGRDTEGHQGIKRVGHSEGTRSALSVWDTVRDSDPLSSGQ